MRKRILAAFLAVCMGFTAIPAEHMVYGTQKQQEWQGAESAVTPQEGEDSPQTAAPEPSGPGNAQDTWDANEPAPGALDTEDKGDTDESPSEDADTEDTEGPAQELSPGSGDFATEKSGEEDAQKEVGLNYLLVESPYIETPGTQNIVVSIGEEYEQLEDVAMTYVNHTTGERFVVPAKAAVQDMALFELEFADGSLAGSYEVLEITCRYRGEEKKFDIKKLEMSAVFGVNQQVDANPDDVLINESVLEEMEANVIQMDGEGNVISENVIDDMSGQGIADGLSRYTDIKKAGNLVVVLDAGHDDMHAGARYFGVGEETLTLKIAQYCKMELETYSGVSVYMVRESGACPYAYGGWISSGTCNERRVQFAASVGANIYVSFHLNASTSSGVSGVGVYYPNANYRYDLSEIGRDLAARIYYKLTALGLSTWGPGIMTRDSSDYTYDDGSTADYLGVIRNCKKAGIPAVLIEHAFLSNSNDYYNYLSSDEKLQMLGVADATAIAEKYGLYKKGMNSQFTAVLSQSGGKIYLEWSQADGAAYYDLYRSTQKDSGFKKIKKVTGALNYTDAAVEAGTTYYYKVKPVFSDGRTVEDSAVVSGMALKQPRIVSVESRASRQITLTWKAVAGAAGYLILRDGGNGKYEQVAQVNGKKTNTYTDTVPADQVLYRYKVQAYHVFNNLQGVGTASEPDEGMTIAVPQNIKVLSLDETELEISWNKVSGASYYEIYRCTNINGSFRKIADTSSGSETSYQDDSVKKSKTYYYKIQAVGTSGDVAIYSGQSAAVGGRTIARTKITSVKSVNSKTLQISWEKVADAYGYRVKRSTKKNGTYKEIKTITSAGTVSYKDKKRSPGKTYYYVVEVLSKTGETIGYSGDSAVKSGRTAPLTSIESVAATENGRLDVIWEEVDGAYGYIVKRGTSKNGTFKNLATVRGDTFYEDKNVKQGTTYYYKVETINKVGGVKGYSGDCEAVAGKILPATEITSLKAVDGKTIRLGWKKTSGVGGYLIYRSTKKNGKYEQIAKVKGSQTVKYDDKSVVNGKTYYYKIQTYKKSGDANSVSKFSGSKKAWTIKQAAISAVTGTSGGKVTLNWGEVKNADGYTIYRRIGTSGSFKKVSKVKKSQFKYVDDDIKSGQVYSYRIAANTTLMGKAEGRGDYSATIVVPVLAKNSINYGDLQENNTLTLGWTPVPNATGYELSCSLQKDANFVSLAKTALPTYQHPNLQQGATYYYRVRAYASLSNGSVVYGPWSSVREQVAGHTIMGESSVTVEQMTAYYQSRFTYPAEIYADKGAPDAATFFTILKEEAKAEGVKTEVLFAQVILETGGLRFDGDVAAWQCNFGGIGATGNGVPGEVFADVRTGLRAQTQHLKAYASTEPLNQACVDPRFSLVKRGSAPYVEWLAIPKNPYGGGWAADPDYADKLLNIIQNL